MMIYSVGVFMQLRCSTPYNLAIYSLATYILYFTLYLFTVVYQIHVSSLSGSSAGHPAAKLRNLFTHAS